LGFDDAEETLASDLSVAANGNVFDFDIVGVVPDTQFFSLRASPRAEVYIYSPSFTDVLHVRYEGNTEDVLSGITSLWKELVGDMGLTTAFVDQNLNAEFIQERTEAKMLLSFSLLAVVIACLGLYGSAAFAVDRRTREIGVRKVMGAEIRDIVNLLMWEFSRPVLAANLVAWPVAVWVMLTWLQQFPYQIERLVLVSCCVLAGAIALSIAWLTVMGNTVKVATTNPVYALRYE
jgi:putative ABC transport system permease protein